MTLRIILLIQIKVSILFEYFQLYTKQKKPDHQTYYSHIFRDIDIKYQFTLELCYIIIKDQLQNLSTCQVITNQIRYSLNSQIITQTRNATYELSNEILSKDALILNYAQESKEFKLSDLVKLDGIFFAEKRERKLREIQSQIRREIEQERQEKKQQQNMRQKEMKDQQNWPINKVQNHFQSQLSSKIELLRNIAIIISNSLEPIKNYKLRKKCLRPPAWISNSNISNLIARIRKLFHSKLVLQTNKAKKQVGRQHMIEQKDLLIYQICLWSL